MAVNNVCAGLQNTQFLLISQIFPSHIQKHKQHLSLVCVFINKTELH